METKIKYSVKYSFIVSVAFYVNALLILGNINGIVNRMIGIVAPLSPIILLNSIVLIAILMFTIDVKGRFHTSAILFLAFLAIYIIIGLCAGLIFYEDYHPKASVSLGLRRVLPTIILFYSSYLFFNQRAQEGKTGSVILGLTLISFVQVLLIIFGDKIGLSAEVVGNRDAGRSAGLFGNPNGAGIASNICLVLSLACMFSKKRGFFLYLAIALCSLYASIITFSKAAILLAVIIVLAYPMYMLLFVAKANLLQKTKLVAIIGGFVVAGGMVLTRIDDVFGELSYGQLERLDNILSLLSGEVNEDTTSHRSALWKEAFEKIKKNPLLGYGLESFHRLPSTGLGVHNTYLMIWGEAGIVAIVFFFVFLFNILFKALFLKSYVGRVLTFVLLFVFMFQDALTGHNGLESRMAAIVLALCCSLVYNRNQVID